MIYWRGIRPVAEVGKEDVTSCADGAPPHPLELYARRFERLEQLLEKTKVTNYASFDESSAKLLTFKWWGTDARFVSECSTLRRERVFVMENASRSETSVCFGEFELNLHTRELYRNHSRLKIRGHPMDVLAILLEHPGELVTREMLRNQLWSDDVFVSRS